MFRKREIEPAPPFENAEAAKGPPQPESPRRRLDLPLGSSTPSQVGPPNQVHSQAGARPESGAAPGRETGGKHLIVGRGIGLKGEITACDRLVVEGEVRVTLNETRALEIAPTGRFIGGCEVEEAEIGGAFDGDLTVHGRLLVRVTGEVTGTIRYGELEVERGGRLAGNVGVVGTDMPIAAATPDRAPRDAKGSAPAAGSAAGPGPDGPSEAGGARGDRTSGKTASG